MPPREAPRSPSARLTTAWMVALGLLAAILIVRETFLQLEFRRQVNESRLLGLAASQRVQAERLAKIVPILEAAPSAAARKDAADQLQAAGSVWRRTQTELRNPSSGLGNAGAVELAASLETLDANAKALDVAVEQLLDAVERSMVRTSVPARAVLDAERAFLQSLDGVVFEQERAVYDRLTRVRIIELAVTVAALSILALLGLLVFRPAVRRVSDGLAEQAESEERLRAEASLVELLRDVSIAANEAATVDAAIKVSLERVSAVTGWPVGHALRLSADGDSLEPSGLWHLDDPGRFAPFRSATETMRFPSGTCLPGVVLASGRPASSRDLARATGFVRSSAAEQTGLRSGFAFPVLVGSRVVAVLEFFSVVTEAPSALLMRIMPLIGTQLGRVFERSRAEAELQKEKQSLRAVLDNVEAAIVACDASGVVTLFNRAAQDFHGVPPGTVPADRWSEYHDLFDADGEPMAKEDAPLLRALRGDVLTATEMRILPRSGKRRTVLVSGQAMFDARGSKLGAVVVMHDVTELKSTEDDLRVALDRAVESDRLKSSFLANMSHEIRTPLNIILGYNSMIAEYFQDRGEVEQLPLLDAISRASRRLMNTVHGVLDISKIEVGAFEIRPVPLRLAPLIEKQVQDFRVTALEKGLYLSCEIDEPEAIVLFDEHCFSQSLLNLLDNAIKFTDAGGVTVRLYRDESGGLMLEVRDTGIGIEPAFLPLLFDPFSQEQSGYTRKFEGSGLGLALVKSYLEFNGARISVESEKGKGSSFRISFPREAMESRPQEGAEALQRERLANDLKLGVLVVEDDPETQDYMRAFLGRNYRVFQAQSAAEVREVLDANGDDVRIILMDLSLKGDEDGLAITRQLRTNPRWKDVPIVATTAHAFVEDQKKALAAGCNAFLAKPFSRSELLKTMDLLLTR